MTIDVYFADGAKLKMHSGPDAMKAARLAYDFHQRVDQATWLLGRLFGEGYE